MVSISFIKLICVSVASVIESIADCIVVYFSSPICATKVVGIFKLTVSVVSFFCTFKSYSSIVSLTEPYSDWFNDAVTIPS